MAELKLYRTLTELVVTADNIVRYKVSPLTEIRHSLGKCRASQSYNLLVQGHVYSMRYRSRLLSLSEYLNTRLLVHDQLNFASRQVDL